MSAFGGVRERELDATAIIANSMGYDWLIVVGLATVLGAGDWADPDGWLLVAIDTNALITLSGGCVPRCSSRHISARRYRVQTGHSIRPIMTCLLLVRSS